MDRKPLKRVELVLRSTERYGAKIVSGRKARDAAISRAFCTPGETLVGWIAAGTPSKLVHPRHNDNPDAILRVWNPH